MEGGQEGRRVERKEERKRGRHEGKVVTGRGRLVEISTEMVKKGAGEESRQDDR